MAFVKTRLVTFAGSTTGAGRHVPIAVRPGYICRLSSFRWALEFLTKSYDVAVGDDAGGEVEEGFVNVVAAFPPDA